MKFKRINSVKLESIQRFLSKKIMVILLSLILILICVISFKQGLYLLSNDNYSPELNPTLSFSRYIESPAWRGYRVLGFASESEQADVFRSGMFAVLDTVLPNWSLGQLFSLLSIVIGVLSISFFSSLFVKDFITKRKSPYVFFVSGILYLTTLWTAWVFNFNMMPYVAQFGFFPLLVLCIYLLLKHWRLRNLIFFIFTSILFTSSSVIATLFFVNIAVILIVTLYMGWLHRVSIKQIFLCIGIFMVTQIFWLLPFIQYTLSSSQDIIDSYTNRAITANTIDLEADMMTLPNSARFYTRLLGTVDDPSKETYIFPMSEDFRAYDIYKFVGLLPFIFSLIGLIFVIAKKKYKLIPIWILLFGLLFLIKNENAPFGSIYVWLQENVSLFKQVFRWVSSKLSQPYLILLTVTSLVGFVYFVNFLGSFFKKKERKLFILLPIIVLVSSLLFYSEYLFKGQLFTQRALVSMPSTYYSLQDELKKDQTSRIFYAPPANNGYFREYDWGFVGSQFLAYILPNPLIDMSLAIGSDVGEKAVLELTNDFNSGNSLELNSDLLKYDVKYVLVDRSLVKGRYGSEIEWKYLDEYKKDWKKIWSKDFLELYELKDLEKVKYVESYGNNDVLEVGSFVRKYSQEPIFSPLNIDLSDASVSGNYLVKDIEYSGVDTILYSNFQELNLNEAPANIRKSGTQVKVSPSFPIVKGLGNLSYKEFKLPSDEEYTYVLGESVFNTKEIESGVNIYSSWDSIKNIVVSSKSSLKDLNLTKSFSNIQPGDCSGGKYKVLPDVTPQVKASGFEIEGNTDLPCLYSQIHLDKRMSYVVEVYLNWENNDEGLIGYCLYSDNAKGCLNREKFIYSGDGFGNIVKTIPTLVNGGDKLSLILYALNPSADHTSLLIRNVGVRYSAEYIPIPESSKFTDSKIKALEIKSGEKVTIKVPIMNNGASYVFHSTEKDNLLWQPAIAEDKGLKYSVTFENGQKQSTVKQYINQYQELFVTNPLKKYVWYWSGENLKNIPASVCLTYVGDDKCIVDSTFYDDRLSSEARIFSSLSDETKRLDGSFNGISFKNETVNVLKDFIAMEIPGQWLNLKYKTILPREFSENEAKPLVNSPSCSFYKLKKQDRTDADTLVTIPQAKSDGWVAVGFTSFFFKFLPDSSRVYIDGWKQGWDISGMNNINTILIFYWPNILSYLGYIFILVLLVIPIRLLIINRKKYAKR